jgi:hypothetical protein
VDGQMMGGKGVRFIKVHGPGTQRNASMYTCLTSTVLMEHTVSIGDIGALGPRHEFFLVVSVFFPLERDTLEHRSGRRKTSHHAIECITMMNYTRTWNIKCISIMCRGLLSLPIRASPPPHFPRGLFYPACYLIT